MATQEPQQEAPVQSEPEANQVVTNGADQADQGEEELGDRIELSIHLPERPLLPAAALSGLPEIPSPFKLFLDSSDTLTEVRMTINEYTEGYWLGAFCFRRKAAPSSTSNGKANGKPSTPQLGERLSEWVELKELFTEADKGKEEVFVQHVPFNDTEARTHVLRLRNLLTQTYPNPSDVGLDQGISVQDAVKNPSAWLEEAVQVPVNTVAAKGGKPQVSPPEVAAPFAEWGEKWTSSPLSSYIPSQARPQRNLVTCFRTLGVAPWTVPPQQLRSLGHFFYLHLVTLEGETLYLTASAHGFYVNKSTSSRFDPSPRTPGQISSSLVDLLCFLSPFFLANFGKLFKHPLTERDVAATAPVNTALPANPWLARETPHHPDAMRSQLAFLLTGATSVDTLESTRDWHDELQTAREHPRNTLGERQTRDRHINRVYSEYTLAAVRAIPRVAAGEVQAMNPNDKPEAQMFIANNLFISRGADSVGVYPLLGGDEAAHVAVGKDVRNTCLVNSIDADGLYTLGSVVIDWMGTRWVAQSVVPGLFRQKAPEEENEFLVDVAEAKEKESSRTPEENEKEKSALAARKADLSEEVSYRYGGADGPEIIRDSPAFHTLFEEVARNLHLALHDVKDAKEENHSLWLSVECKGLRGADGRKYILDLARLTPVDIEWLEKDMEGQVFDSDSSKLQDSDEKSVYPHKMTLLRPELLQIYHDIGLRKWVGEQVKELEAKREAEKKEAEGQEKKAEGEEKEDPEKKQERIDASQYKLAYNPDAFVQFKLGGSSPEAQEEKNPKGIVLCSDESDPSVAAVRSASKYLREEAAPAFVSEVASGVSVFLDGATLTEQMHGRGINVRYLGLLAQLATPGEVSKLDQTAIAKFGPGYEGLLKVFYQIALQEMVVRASKRVLRSLLKTVEEAAGTFFTSTGACVSHFFNCLLGSSREPSPAAVFESSPLYLDSHPPSWTEVTPASIEQSIRAEVMKRYRFSLPSDYFSTSLRKPQVLREVCLRTGVQLKLQDYHFEASANLNGHAQETSEESVNETPAVASTSTKKKKGKKSKASAAAEAEHQRKPRTTTFEPSDVLNLVPIVKDSAPKSSIAEQTFETGRMHLIRGTTLNDRNIGLDLLAQGLHFSEQVYGTIHTEVAKVFQAYANLIHTFTVVEHQERQVKIARAQREGQPEPTEEELQGHPDFTLANAIRHQRLAVTISERANGLDSVETLTAYNNLAAFERAEGLTEDALKSHARSLELMDLIHGASNDHPEAVTLIAGVGVTMYSGGKTEQAIGFLREAYSAGLRIYGSESLQVGNLAHELAQAYTMAKDLKTAVTIEKEALRIFEARLGKDDQTTKEADQFLSSLTNAAVQMAKNEKDRQSRIAARGLPSLGSSIQRSSAARQAASTIPTASPANKDASAPSIDELVTFIQGGSSSSKTSTTSTASKGKKARGRK